MSRTRSKEMRLVSLWREWLRNTCNAIPALFVAVLALSSEVGSAAPADDDMAIARSLAEMLRDARTVISNQQDLINDPNLGDKHLTGKIVVEQTVKIYSNTTGVDPRKVDPTSREGRLLRAMMAAIAEAVDDNQATINAKGTGFKGFIPAVFAAIIMSFRNVDVELQNHPIMDGFADRLAALRARKPGDPNPFVVGQENNSRFVEVMH